MTACFGPRIGYVVNHFSQIPGQPLIEELLGLEQCGLNVRVFALQRGDTPAAVSGPRVPVTYLPGRGQREAGAQTADWLATQVLGRGITHLHSYSMDRNTDVGREVAALTEITYSFSIEAHDLTPGHVRPRELRARARAAQFVVTRTAASLGRIAEICGAGVMPKIHWMSEGIDLTHLPFYSELRTSERLLAVAGPTPGDGLEDALVATAILHARGRRLTLTVVAPDHLHASVQESAARHGVWELVSVVAPSDEAALHGLMREHTLLLAPWRNAATPAEVPDVLLNAMALGLTIVAADVPGLREAIDDGWTGRLVKAGNPKWFAGAIETLLDQPRVRRRMARAARERLEQFCTARNVAFLDRLFAQASLRRQMLPHLAPPPRVAPTGSTLRDQISEVHDRGKH